MKNKNNNENTFITISGHSMPTLSDPALWDRVQAHHAGLAADAAFVGRLRAEGALNEPDPQPLLLEYLRFAYLAWVMPEGATPSKAVDEVWHTHILFTRSYARFCAETRGETLHHDPGGGEADEARFREAYRRTLLRYEAEFGPPPARFWARPAAPPEGIPQQEPPRVLKAIPETVPKTPIPSSADPPRRFPPLSPVLAAALAGPLVYLATASAPAAMLCGLLCGMLAFVALATEQPRPRPRQADRRPPASPRPLTHRPPPRHRPASARRRDGASTTGAGTADGGLYPVSSAQACTPSHHGDAGSGCDDGGSGGGSSCGGGGCGGG